jgi:hypothetical protein
VCNTYPAQPSFGSVMVELHASYHPHVAFHAPSWAKYPNLIRSPNTSARGFLRLWLLLYLRVSLHALPSSQMHPPFHCSITVFIYKRGEIYPLLFDYGVLARKAFLLFEISVSISRGDCLLVLTYWIATCFIAWRNLGFPMGVSYILTSFKILLLS